jgi:hypothetical protein
LIDYQGYFKAVKRKRLDTAAFIFFLTAKYKMAGYLCPGWRVGYDNKIRPAAFRCCHAPDRAGTSHLIFNTRELTWRAKCFDDINSRYQDGATFKVLLK